MSTVEKLTLAVLAFLVSAAMAATAIFRRRAASADKKIRVLEIADGANAAAQQARLVKLARIEIQLDTQAGTPQNRSADEVIAELRRKNLLK